jgi:glycine/D-amino acid oxidase-like deaminating enzyme
MTSENSNSEIFYRSQSYWLDSVPGSLHPRAALEGECSADVVIVGGGYTGLWTAYYLKHHSPDLNIVVIEAEIAGFGASGRNGGWCSAYLSGLGSCMDDPATRTQAIELQRLMFDTVDEVGRVAAREDIDCHFSKSGHVAAAVNPSQLERDKEHVAWMKQFGFGEQDIRWLNPEELHQQVRIDGAQGGFFMSHCAAIHPARLARGLAEVLEKKGVTLFERSPVTHVNGGHVHTAAGQVRAETVLLATEGYTGSLSGIKRKLIPVHSTMIATEPLTETEIEATGLNHRCTWNNGKHLVTYGQLTADGRIAFGSRGNYRYGARVQREFKGSDPVFQVVRQELAKLFPVLENKPITHAWGGPMGVSRTLRPAVCFDQTTRFGWAGGFFGDGVGATNLAGRTLADLVLNRDSRRSRTLWVNPPVEKYLARRLWEPEPIRWLGVRARYGLMQWADRAEKSDSALAPGINWMLENLFP